ncbi:MAG TPA: L-threonylcarbamoyladenylate synthase [Candidatus Deferrimicrobiaceae bacterium]
MTRLVRLDVDRVVYLPREVVASLKSGGMAVFPTDTLYGLGVDPTSEAGLARLLAIKRREGGKPIPLLLSGAEAVDRFARHVPVGAARLMGRFWPGALTIVLPAEEGVDRTVTGGGDTVGLRVPDHPVPRALAQALGGAITGTSANRSGNPGDWDSAEEIVREFTGEADWVLWDGKIRRAATREVGTGRSPGSTVVRMTDDRPVLLREGVLPFRDITEFLERG